MKSVSFPRLDRLAPNHSIILKNLLRLMKYPLHISIVCFLLLLTSTIFGCKKASTSVDQKTSDAKLTDSVDTQRHAGQNNKAVMDKLGLNDIAITKEVVESKVALQKEKSKKRVLDDSSIPRRRWIQTSEVPRETWEVQYLGNTPVGFTHERVKGSAIGTDGTLRIESTSLMRVLKGNEKLNQKLEITSLEQVNGKLKSIELQFVQGEDIQKTTAIVTLDRMRIRTESKEGIRSRDIVWHPDTGGPFSIMQSLKRRPMKAGETRELDMFDPLLGGIVAVTLVAGDYVNTPKLEGEQISMLEIRSMAVFEKRQQQTLLWVDEKGESLKSYASRLDVRSFRCEESMAYRVRDSLRSDLKSPIDIPIKGDPTGIESMPELILRIGHKDGDGFRVIPQDEYQILQTVAPFDVTLRIARAPVLGSERKLDPNAVFVSDPSFRGPTPLLQSDDYVITRIAEESLVNEDLGKWPLERLVHGVATWMKEKTPFTPAMKTAAEAARAFRGSANEHAILLAAVIRTQGIPSRVVSGMRYRPGSSPPVMEYHAWTELEMGGRWIAVDATQPSGEVNSTYVRLTASSMSSYNPYEAMLPTLEILEKLTFTVESPK